jgi:translocator protein
MRLMTEPHSTEFFKKGLWWKILVSVLVIMVLGGGSGYLTQTGAGSWYTEIDKPVFTPPNWLFGPAWTALYILMGVSFARIWQVAVRSRYPIISTYAKQGMGLFIVHFVLNVCWTPVFFGLESPLGGLVIILTMLFMIGWIIKHFVRLDRIAGFILVPYFLWVSFATLLNLSILILNW